MSLQLRWVEDDEHDRVALARMRAYAPSGKDLPRYQEGIRLDPRARSGDYLLAEVDGDPVATATSLSLTMWVRGGPVACQGVAYVGTARTHRRGGSVDRPGIASQLMQATLDRARERGQPVTALMPFRNSFYERFGYGTVERRTEYVLPTNLLPSGDFEGFRHARESDVEALAVCRQKQVCLGQCDIKRTRESWLAYLRRADEGFLFIDRPVADGPARGYLRIETTVRPDGRWHLKVLEQGHEDAAAFLRSLRLLSSLKDQYAACTLTLPREVPLERLLRESQLPHRVVTHACAEGRLLTRMMVRILDHKAFLESMVELPPAGRGRAVVAVREPDQTVSKFLVDVRDGRATVSATEQSPDFSCDSAVWAAVACGDLSAEQAVRYRLADCAHQPAWSTLNLLAEGPSPFCVEAF